MSVTPHPSGPTAVPAGQARGTVLSRSTWILSDQGLASLFSLVLGFAAARTLSDHDFGLFATLFTSLLLARGVVRAIALDPITIRYAGPRTRDHAGYATATTVAVSVLGTAGAVAVSLFGGPLGPAEAVAAGAALFVLLMVDNSRLIDIAAGHPLRAVQTSAVLLAVTVVVFVISWFTSLGLAPLLTITALGGGLTLAIRRPVWGARHRPSEVGRWLTGQRHLATPLLIEFLTNTGALFMTVYLLAVIDLTEAGVYRAAQMVAGPLFMLFTGITQVVMTEGARSTANAVAPDAVAPGAVAPTGRRRTRQRDTAIMVAQRSLLLSVAVSAAYLLVVWLARDVLADALKIEDAAHRGTLTGIVILAALTAPSFVASGLLRALATPRLLLIARLVAMVSVVSGSLYGAFHGGAVGVVHYGILAELANVPLWSFCVAAAIRARRRINPVAAAR